MSEVDIRTTELIDSVRNKYRKREIIGSEVTSYVSCGGGLVELSGSGHRNLVNVTYDVIYILKGNGYYIDDSGLKSYWEEGCIYQRVPNLNHSTMCETDSIQVFFSMPAYYWETLKKVGIIDGSQRIIRPGINNSLLEIFSKIEHCLDQSSHFSFQFSLSYMQQFLIEAQKLEMQQINSKGLYASIENAANDLSDLSQAQLTIQDIAEKNNIGYEVFRKAFKQQYGLSPHAFRIKRRIEQAMTWLAITSRSVDSIATSLGYPDQFCFSKQFKKVTGYSPREYRSRH